MQSRLHAIPTLLVVALALSACGGGGGGASGTAAPVARAISGLAVPANFSFQTFKSQTLTASQALQAVGGFAAANTAQAYVKAWYLDAAGARQQLVFISLASLSALGSGGMVVRVPANISSLSVEIYDTAASKSGVLAL